VYNELKLLVDMESQLQNVLNNKEENSKISQMKQILVSNKFKVLRVKDYFKEYDELIDSCEKWIAKASKSEINAEELFVELN
jgi:hypothetical protein